MARIVNTTITPVLIANVQTIMNDGSISNMTFKKDDILTDMRYIENKDIVKISGKVRKINYTILPTVRTYTELSKLRSNFESDVYMNTVDIDASEKYNSNIVTIPAREIIENENIKDVSRVKCSLKYSADFEIKLTDGTTNKFTLHEGDDIIGLEYLSDGKEKTINARLVAMKYNSSLIPTDLVLIVNGKIEIIEVLRVKNITSTVTPIMAGTNISDAVKSATDGKLSVDKGTFSDVLTLDKDIVIRGAKAEIPATSKRVSKLENETVLTGSIKITNGANVTFDGVTFSKNALIDATGAANITIKNCILTDIIPNAPKAYLIKTGASDIGKVEITDCFIGKNQILDGKKIYNLFELQGTLKTGSVFSNIYFEEGCSNHNDINIYQVEDGAHIAIENNTWEFSNGIRVGIKGEPKCTIDVNNNRYMKTEEDPNYAGIMLIQPYGTATTSMANLVINFNDTVYDEAVEGEKYQIYYLYAGSKDMQFTESNVPTVYIDGVLDLQPVPKSTTEEAKVPDTTVETPSSDATTTEQTPVKE